MIAVTLLMCPRTMSIIMFFVAQQMADDPKRVKLRSSEFWKSLYDSNFEPHWAIQILLDPKGVDLPELVRDGEYPIVGSIPWEPVTPEIAMGSFDMETDGWVPYWFPRTAEPGGNQLDSISRLNWFDRALAYYAQTEWPPTGSIGSKQHAVALSLLWMLYEVELQGIPPPDKMA
jgi:hypothetical protein